jgi:hypothetical protein
VLRRLCLGVLFSIASAAGVGVGMTFSSNVSATMPAGEFWRLPWKADSSRIVSGYGYNEGTHDDLDAWALDFQASEGTYITAVQEGQVVQLVRLQPRVATRALSTLGVEPIDSPTSARTP